MQAIALAIGVLVVGLAWLGPLSGVAARGFSAHMATHMAVVAIAAPLVAFGLSGRRFDPVRRAPALFRPIPASLVELVVVWAWHAPAWHHAAKHDPRVFALEQAMFAIAGLLLWLSVLGGGPERRSAGAVAGVTALLLTSMHMTLLGALLALTPRSLYPYLDGWFGLTPIADQHLGGSIMLLVGGVSYLAGGLWLMTGLLRRTAIVSAHRA